jgi:NAD-dependent SIR2 family protein deacetylase
MQGDPGFKPPACDRAGVGQCNTNTGSSGRAVRLTGMSDVHLNVLGPEALRRQLSGRQPPDAVLLLGAGASVKSGVPAAGDMVAMAGKWAWCQRHGRAFDDQAVTPSDWRPWLHEQPWFDQSVPLAELYPLAVEHLLQPRESRRQFFLNVLKSATVSEGYQALATLLAARAVLTVLTVNFDGLVARAARADRNLPHITEVHGPPDLEHFSLSPTFPQVVELHGSVERYQDRNLEAEVQQLDQQLQETLLPLVRDHPIVVVGYRGAERSIMKDLLIAGAEQPHAYRHGLYWCVRGNSDEELHPHVQELAERLSTNFSLVQIAGFEEAMTGWATGVTPAQPPPWSAAEEPDVPDLRPVATGIEDIDTRLLHERRSDYERRFEGSSAVVPVAKDGWASLRALRLVRDAEGDPTLTRAAELLFSRREVTRVEVKADDAFLPITGNLFNALRRTEEAIDELNAPFRLKAAVSEEVRRFDPRAIKELLVNALAHRDHDDGGAVRITVSDRLFQVVSPGGLVAGVSPESLGTKGIKAYRNPLIADVLYGAGAMDKAGSGLADVHRWTRQAGGEATFGTSEDGASSVATMTARDVALDETTGTADPGQLERFSVNALEIEPPPIIHTARTKYRQHGMVYRAHPDVSFPPFALTRGGMAASFETFDGPLAKVGGPTGTSLPAADDERLTVELLNAELLSWARDRDLHFHRPSLRLWFGRAPEGALEITYRARVREATRTVVKPQLASDGERVRHWLHEAVRCSFKRYGDVWVFHLLPTVVFTTDGYGRLLKGPKVGPMATRALARDFNPQVQNDLYFWRWVFCGDEAEAALGPITIRASFPTSQALDAPTAVGGFGDPDEAELALRTSDDDEDDAS